MFPRNPPTADREHQVVTSQNVKKLHCDWLDPIGHRSKSAYWVLHHSGVADRGQHPSHLIKFLGRGDIRKSLGVDPGGLGELLAHLCSGLRIIRRDP